MKTDNRIKIILAILSLAGVLIFGLVSIGVAIGNKPTLEFLTYFSITVFCTFNAYALTR